VLQRTRFVLGENDDLTGPFREPLKQPSNPPSATLALRDRVGRSQVEGQPMLAQ
jgi:hypothetical protein